MTKGDEWRHCFVSRSISDCALLSNQTSTNAFAFPLRLEPSLDGMFATHEGLDTNLSRDFLVRVASALGVSRNRKPREQSLNPEDVFHYAYAVFHSPGYRTRFSAFLKIQFPRLPLTEDLELFRGLARIGAELTALHLLESPGLTHFVTKPLGGRNVEVDRVSWSRDTVWLDKAQTTGFRGVPESVWNFHIGGYQVCEKWLKDRKGRTLSQGDIAHYQKIVVALSETIRLMAEIDRVIDEHGGWPAAFQATASA